MTARLTCGLLILTAMLCVLVATHLESLANLGADYWQLPEALRHLQRARQCEQKLDERYALLLARAELKTQVFEQWAGGRLGIKEASQRLLELSDQPGQKHGFEFVQGAKTRRTRVCHLMRHWVDDPQTQADFGVAVCQRLDRELQEHLQECRHEAEDDLEDAATE